MRVISGSARSLRLKTIEGNGTRPTTDRIKETLFNMINDRLYDCRFLDLFSGSGAIGIEALSRGAREAVFVENNKKAVSCIKENLKFTKLIDRAQIIERNAESAVAGLSGRFDVIFMDPPYDNEYEKKMLELISKSDIADRDTLIIVEASLDTKMDYLNEYGYDIVKEKTYKTNKHIFIQKS
ncbi:16S rRNA (guanine(966)-N(2))-methyltransferase RsmD [Lachnospiraceae bacterium HCP1S3_C3]|nr:16S rRNA (guanine(966)-N(2))-methyltransferase RsmD [Lachnospiraceae bacterium]MDD6858152.1 16S rRNA (guanine(966)-N(2))-methyltransferase RsmD [Lachnospiraceae bacterium]